MSLNRRFFEEEFSRFENELAEATKATNDLQRDNRIPIKQDVNPQPSLNFTTNVAPAAQNNGSLLSLPVGQQNMANTAGDVNIFLPHFLPPHIQRQHRLAMQRKCIESRPVLYNQSQRNAAEQTLSDAQPSMKERIEQVIKSDMEALARKQRAEKRRKRKFVRTAGGEVWEDETLQEWDSDDFRLFCGDLGNEVNDDTLANAFKKYASFQRAKVVRDKRSGKTKGYGFVSFRDSQDFISAMREMNGKYVGNRPIKLRKSTWKDRNIDVVKKKSKDKAAFANSNKQS